MGFILGTDRYGPACILQDISSNICGGVLNIGAKLRIQSVCIVQIGAIGVGFMMGIGASCLII